MRAFLCASASALCLTLFGNVSASADDCGPLKLYTSIGLTASDETRQEFVPVTIEGVAKLMLLDTGGVNTEITREAADELKLPHRRGGFKLYDVTGAFSSEFTQARFSLGPLKTDKMYMVISPGTNMFAGNPLIAGILAPNILKNYDVEIDFGSNKMSLLSQDHCPGKVIFWPAVTVAVVPMNVLDSGHIVVPVVLDGRSILAFLDTGAYNTTLTQPVAESDYDIKPGSADTPKTGELRPGAPTFRHQFKSLGFEGIAVTNPSIDIIPDITHDIVVNATEPETGTRIPSPQAAEATTSLLIGMDILRHFHLYIAYKEKKLYITPAGEPTPSTPVSPPLPPH